jgi:mono/diheme cytochrome c family protein
VRTNLSIGVVLVAVGLVFACGDDDDDSPGPSHQAGAGGEASGDAGSGTTAAGTGNGNGGGGDGAGGDGGLGGAALAARGKYLVEHVSVCIDCHTPRTEQGAPDLDNYLAGADCFIDIDPDSAEVGCLSTPNLTNHATGLKNRTDEEIKDMFLNGLRPDGSALHPVMPYYSFGNMTDQDANAIVAYLRTVPGVDHEVEPAQAPFLVDEPATRVDLDSVPMPDQDSPDFDSAMRGRYLAAQAGVCLECHTPSNAPGSAEPRDLERAFWGGEEFQIGSVTVYSRNLTPHATGLAGWTKADIVKALKEGVNPDDHMLCPPMPAGPMGAFGGLTDADAGDIAAYLLTLEPAENEVPMCMLGMPGAGGEGGMGGAGAGGQGGQGGAMP